jgi:hypothetical protein
MEGRKNMFRASGTAATGTVAVLDMFNGQIVCDSLSYTGDAAGLLKFYRARNKGTANAACSANTTLKINTDAAGKVGGAVLTTSDYILVRDSASAGWQLRSISNVGAVSSSVVTLTLGAAATCASGDVLFVVRAADIHSVTIGAETKLNLLNMFNGFPNYPVAVEITGSTGSKFFSGTYTVQQV